MKVLLIIKTVRVPRVLGVLFALSYFCNGRRRPRLSYGVVAVQGHFYYIIIIKSKGKMLQTLILFSLKIIWFMTDCLRKFLLIYDSWSLGDGFQYNLYSQLGKTTNSVDID